MSLNNFGFLGNEIEEIKTEILSLNSDYFDLVSRLNIFFQRAKFKFKVNDQEIQKAIVAALLIKASETMQAIYILCSFGMENDTNILLRALFENIVTIKYCLIGELETKNYLAKDSYERKKQLNIIKNSKSLSAKIELSEDEKTRISSEIEKDIEFLGSSNRISLEDMCGKTGESDLYNTFYRVISDTPHSGPRVLQEFCSLNGSVSKFIWGPKNKNMKQPLITSAELILKVLPQLVVLLCPEEQEKINGLKNDYNNLAKQHLKRSHKLREARKFQT